MNSKYGCKRKIDFSKLPRKIYGILLTAITRGCTYKIITDINTVSFGSLQYLGDNLSTVWGEIDHRNNRKLSWLVTSVYEYAMWEMAKDIQLTIQSMALRELQRQAASPFPDLHTGVIFVKLSVIWALGSNFRHIVRSGGPLSGQLVKIWIISKSRHS